MTMIANVISILLIYFINANDIDNIIEEEIIKGRNDIDVYNSLKLINNDKNLKTRNNTMIKMLYSKEYYRSLFYYINSYYQREENEDELVSDIVKLQTYMKDNLIESKEIIKLTPLFEWGQNHTHVKMRIKFSKGLEVPGDKDITNFTVNITSTVLFVSGYNNKHKEYLLWYYRRINLFAIVKPFTLKYYQETEGAYIVSFEKGVYTMYWNFLDLEIDDHLNIFTWFDIFEKYNNEVKFVEYRDWTQDNILLSNMDSYINDKIIEKEKRKTAINNLINNENVNKEVSSFCNSIPLKRFCNLNDIYNWNYWIN